MKKYFKLHSLIYLVMIALLLSSCTEKPAVTKNEFKFQVDRFDDTQILRYQIPDFESLDLRQKKLLYYLSEAAKCGRDITFDQNFKYNLLVRKTLDAIVSTY